PRERAAAGGRDFYESRVERGPGAERTPPIPHGDAPVKRSTVQRLEEALGVDRGHASRARRCDGLSVAGILDVAGGEDAGDARRVLGEVRRLLHRGVAAADDRELLVLEEEAVARRAGRDAIAHEALLGG